jgi:hypothetical protein
VPPKRVHFSAAARGGESERLPQLLPLGDRQPEGAMEDVAGAQRTDCVEMAGVSCNCPASSSQVVPRGPRVAARKDAVSFASFFKRLALRADAGGLL